MSRRASVTLVLAAALTTATAAPGLVSSASAVTCGIERWSVKTGTDTTAAGIDLTTATPTTVADLSAIAAPASPPDDSRVSPVETTVFDLTATLTQFKIEDDGDYHLVLRDDAGRTLIAELPDPVCVAPTSPLLPGIQSARASFDATFRATTSWTYVASPVRLLGVGFVDDLHGQTGAAVNSVELHPLLSFSLATLTSPSPVPVPVPAPVPVPKPQVRISVRPATIRPGQAAAVALRGVPGERLGLWAYTLPSHTYRLVRTGTGDSTGLVSWSVRPAADTRLYGTAAAGARRSSSAVLQVRPARLVAAPAPAPSGAYYRNCDAVRAAGKAPLYRGQPGYRPALDRDGDGIACEWLN